MDHPTPIPSLTILISQNREKILDGWIDCPSLSTIIKQLQLTPEAYRESIARPVLEYLISILEGENRMGDCPVMRDVVQTFYNKGLAVEDVFLNCTGLKNAIIALCFEKPGEACDLPALFTILDKNLYRILSIYTEKLIEHERTIQEHAGIIEEYVLLTMTDIDGKITYVTDAFCELSGYAKHELLDHSHAMIRHPDMSDDFFDGMWRRILEGKVWKGKIKNRKKDGGYFIARTEIIPVTDKEGKITEFMAIRHDITDKEMSQFDALTKLYNRASFDRLYRSAFKKEGTFSLMILDIDHFKRINDTFGHSEGDRVIMHVADIIRDNTRDADICCRWGGEEFVILLPKTDRKIAFEVAERVRASLEHSRIMHEDATGEHPHRITCSVGVTEKLADDQKKSLFERADTLLYEAKSEGRNRTVSR